MDVLSSGLTVLVNGLWGLLHAVVSPVTVLIVILGVSLLLMSVTELEEMQKQAVKPEVPFH